MKKKIKTYEVGLAVNEVWVFRVEATSKKAALAEAQSGKGEQNCTITGKRGFVREIKPLKPKP